MNEQNDLQLEQIIGGILKTGVTLSTVCLAVGLVLTFAHVQTAAGGVLLQAGLIILVGTPIARVATAFVTYLVEHDLMFTTLTGIVLAELGAAVLAALVKH